MIKILKVNIINYYYLAVMTLYFSAIYLPFFRRVGLFMSLIMLIGVFILFKKKLFSIKNNLDLLVSGYIVYNIFSFFWFITISDLPLSVFYKELSNTVLPIILFYFFGRLKETISFYDITLYSLVTCFAVGFYYQFTLPQNYVEFMTNLDGSRSDPVNTILNYRSFLGLTATGSLSAISILLSFNILYKSNFKSGKIIFLICFLALIFTFRRAALYTGFFAMVWMNLLIIIKFNGPKFKFLFIEFFFIILFIYFFISFEPDFIESVLERFYSFFSAIDERSYTWFSGVSKAKNIVFGDGLGVYGHKAVEFSDTYIPDGNYFRIIAELGVFGFLIFISVILTSFYHGFSNFKNNYIELGLIMIICLQAIGSNIFSFQLVAPIFWYSIGRCNRFTLTN